MASRQKVAHFQPQTESWTDHSPEEALVADGIRDIAADSDGALWIVSWRGDVSRFNGAAWQEFTPTDDIEFDEIHTVSIAPDNSVWFASGNGALHWQRELDTWTAYTWVDGLAQDSIEEILFTLDGRIWFTANGSVTSLLPAALSGQGDIWQIFPESIVQRHDYSNGYDVAVIAPDGSIWFSGQRLFDPNRGEWFETPYKQYGGTAADLAVDSNGGLWIVRRHGQGIIYIPEPLTSRWDHLLTFGPRGIGRRQVYSIAAAGNEVWFGAEDATVSRCRINQP